MENKNFWNKNITEEEKEFWKNETIELDKTTANTGEGEVILIPTKRKIKNEIKEILEKNYEIEETLIKLYKELEEKEKAIDNSKNEQKYNELSKEIKELKKLIEIKNKEKEIAEENKKRFKKTDKNQN